MSKQSSRRKRGKNKAPGSARAENSAPAEVQPAAATEVRVTRAIQHQGPLPSPAILEEYDQVIPGLKNTIVHMWTSEADHQRARVQQALNAQIEEQKAARKETRIGQILGFVIHLTVLFVAAYTAYLGYPTQGSVLGVTAVTALLAAFLRGRAAPSEELRE